MTQEHGEQLMDIQAIRFRPAVAAIDLEARRVDHGVLDALADEKTMEPKAIAAGFVATHHPGRLGQAKAACGPAYLLQDRLAIARQGLVAPAAAALHPS
jgi:hypothetical protein